MMSVSLYMSAVCLCGDYILIAPLFICGDVDTHVAFTGIWVSLFFMGEEWHTVKPYIPYFGIYLTTAMSALLPFAILFSACREHFLSTLWLSRYAKTNNSRASLFCKLFEAKECVVGTETPLMLLYEGH